MRAWLFRFSQFERCERGTRVQAHLGHDAAAHEGKILHPPGARAVNGLIDHRKPPQVCVRRVRDEHLAGEGGVDPYNNIQHIHAIAHEITPDDAMNGGRFFGPVAALAPIDRWSDQHAVMSDKNLIVCCGPADLDRVTSLVEARRLQIDEQDGLTAIGQMTDDHGEGFLPLPFTIRA
jgi:hypothetical protein